MLIINTDEQDPDYNFNLIHHAIIPRPVFLISTVSSFGINVAPYSYVNGCSHSPPAVSIAFNHLKDGGFKDTLLNIRESGSFVLNAVNEHLLFKANQCAYQLPRGQSEFDAYDLKYVFRDGSDIPHVLESPFTMYCELLDEITIGDIEKGSVLVIGKVKLVYLQREAIVSESPLSFAKATLTARVGTDEFFTLVGIKTIHIPRK